VIPNQSPSYSSVESVDYAPEFLRAYDRLRAPFDERRQFDNRRRAARLVRRRRPWRDLLDDDDPVREQRPAPLLQLRAASEEDAATVTGMLEERSGDDPVAVLSRCESRGEAAPPYAGATAYQTVRRTEEDVSALVDELRRGRGRRIDGPRLRAVRPLEFPRTQSLLDLFAVYGETYRERHRAEDEEYPGGRRDHRNPLVVAEALWRKARKRREARKAVPEREEQAGEDRGDGQPRRGVLRRIGAAARRTLDDGVGLVGKGYTGLYLGTSRLLQFLGAGRADAGFTFDRFDQWVMTPLGMLINFLLGLSLLLGIRNIPDLEALERVLTVLLLVLLVLLRALLYLGLSQPWRPYRWLPRQPYLPRGASAAPHHRAVTQHVGETYRRLQAAHAEGDRRDLRDQARMLRLLLVNALLEDLAAAYPERHRYRTGFHRPALVADRYATRWRGGGEDSPERDADLVRLIEQVRAEQYAPDPLVVVEVVADPAPPAARETGSAVRELTAWADRRRRVAHLGPSRTVSVDIGPGAGEREQHRGRVRGAERTEPTTAQRWRNAATAAGVGAVVLLLLVGTVAVLDLFHRRNGNECWRPLLTEPGVAQAQRGGSTEVWDCVGYTDGSFVFHPSLEAVQERIEAQNDLAVSGKEPYVTVVYFGQMSFRKDDSRTAGVKGELMGLAVRQYHHNRYAPEGVPRIRLLIANAGYRWEHGAAVAEWIGQRISEDDIVAAVGFGQSMETTRETIRKLSGYALPMVSSTATYDYIGTLEEAGEEGGGEGKEDFYSDFFFPTAPSNSRVADQTAELVAAGRVGGEVRNVLALAYTAEAELYGPHLAKEFIRALESRDGSVRGRVDGYSDVAELGSVVDDICRDGYQPDLVYYAGRSPDFGYFLDELNASSGCIEKVTVLASDDIAQYVADKADKLKDRAISVYYTPLAMRETVKPEFREDLDTLAEELGEDNASVAHAAMAHDALTVVSTALMDAAALLPGPRGRSAAFPALLLPEIQEIEDLAGASGDLDLTSDGGHWYDRKLVLLATVDGEGDQELVAECGRAAHRSQPPLGSAEEGGAAEGQALLGAVDEDGCRWYR